MTLWAIIVLRYLNDSTFSIGRLLTDSWVNSQPNKGLDDGRWRRGLCGSRLFFNFKGVEIKVVPRAPAWKRVHLSLELSWWISGVHDHGFVQIFAVNYGWISAPEQKRRVCPALWGWLRPVWCLDVCIQMMGCVLICIWSHFWATRWGRTVLDALEKSTKTSLTNDWLLQVCVGGVQWGQDSIIHTSVLSLFWPPTEGSEQSPALPSQKSLWTISL